MAQNEYYTNIKKTMCCRVWFKSFLKGLIIISAGQKMKENREREDVGVVFFVCVQRPNRNAIKLKERERR